MARLWYCDGCDVPLTPDRIHLIQVAWQKPEGDKGMNTFELCQICFELHHKKLKPGMWPQLEPCA